MKQTLSLIKKSVLVINLLGIAAVLGHAQTPVAAWDFTTGSAASLTSTNGNFTLSEYGLSTGPYTGTFTFTTGGVDINGYASLASSDINSTAFPTTNGFTLYSQLIINSSFQSGVDGAIFGVVNGPVNVFGNVGTYSQVTMVARSLQGGGTTQGLTPFADTADNPNSIGMYPPRLNPALGTIVDVALVYNPSPATINGTSYTTPTVTLYEGSQTEVIQLAAGDTLNSFNQLAIGNIFGTAYPTSGITYKDFSVYNQALTDSQIAQIGSVPEPSASTLLIPSALVLIFLVRRRYRAGV